MSRRVLSLVLVVCGGVLVSAQARTPARAAAVSPRLEAATLACPSPLGVGVSSKREFCDIPIGRMASDGVSVKIPAAKGAPVLIFDLHNRLVYSEELVKARRSYALTTATIGVMTPDNTLVDRAVVRSEFRAATDLYDRIGGGAGPGGLKAVAPSGVETVRMTLPEGTTEVFILGERLHVSRFEGNEVFQAPGRPIAVVSNVLIEYLPAPVPKAPTKPATKTPARKTPAKKTSRR